MAAIRGCPLAAALPAARALLVEPIAKKARFLTTAIEATGLAGTVEAAAVRSEDLAADPRHRGRWPAVTARAVAALPELVELAVPLLAPDGVLVAWKRGDPSDPRRPSRPSWRRRTGRSPRSVAGVWRCIRSTPPGSMATSSWSSQRAAVLRRGTRVTRARAVAGHGERRTTRLERRADRRRLGRSFQPARPRRGPRQGRRGRWLLAPWRRRRYGPEPDAVVERLSALGAIGVRGNHDGAAVGGTEIDWFNPEARAAMEWTRSTISDTTREWLAALPKRREEGDLTLVHGSPRDPTWEYVTSTSIAKASLSAISTRHGLHGHTHIPVVFTELDGRLRTLEPRAGNSVDLERRADAPEPGQRRPAARRRPAGELPGPRYPSRAATWGRVAYDFEAVGNAMRALGLPEPAGGPSASSAPDPPA